MIFFFTIFTIFVINKKKNTSEKKFQPQKRKIIQNQKLIGQFSHVQFLKERNQSLIRKVADLKNEIDMDDDQTYLLIPPTNRQYSSSHLCQGSFYNQAFSKK